MMHSIHSLALVEGEGTNPYLAFIILAIVLTLAGFILMIARRYKRCPSNRILVIYGKTAAGRSAKCLHGGGAFVWADKTAAGHFNASGHRLTASLPRDEKNWRAEAMPQGKGTATLRVCAIGLKARR